MSLPPSRCLHAHVQCCHGLLLLAHRMQMMYQPQLMPPLLHVPSHVLGSLVQPGWQMEPAHRCPLPGRPRVRRRGADVGLYPAPVLSALGAGRSIRPRAVPLIPMEPLLSHAMETSTSSHHCYFHTHSGYEQAVPEKISISVALGSLRYDCSH